MRSLRRATCTSGDPVSAVWVLYVPMTSDLRSLVNATLVPPRTAQTSVAYRHRPRPPLQFQLTQYLTLERRPDAKARLAAFLRCRRASPPRRGGASAGVGSPSPRR